MVAFFGPHTFVITSFSFLEVVVLCIGNPFFNNYTFITQHHCTILCESLVLRFFFISLTYTSHTTSSCQLKNSMMFGGFIEILRTFAVVQKLKKAMKGLDLKTVLAAVALLGTVCNAASQEKADGRGALAAPQVEVDANGLFTVEDCPTVYDRFNIVFHVSDYVISSADILWDGVECQTVSFDADNDCVTRMAVHYLDANFDGYLDILLGAGTNREYSALLLWDEEENMFVRATNDGFVIFNGDFFYEPERMTVYRRTSSSYAETTYTMMVWQGSDLQSEETFLIIGDKSRYDDYHVTHRYTVRGYYSDEEIISTDDPASFEGLWNEWAIKKLME